jgi:hypothetical protein
MQRLASIYREECHRDIRDEGAPRTRVLSREPDFCGPYRERLREGKELLASLKQADGIGPAERDEMKVWSASVIHVFRHEPRWRTSFTTFWGDPAGCEHEDRWLKALCVAVFILGEIGVDVCPGNPPP